MRTIKYLVSQENKIFGELKYTLDIFSDYKKHFHTHFGLALIDEGRIEITYHVDDTYYLDTHSIAIFNPTQIHQTQVSAAKGYYVLFLDKHWCGTLKKDFFFSTPIIDNKEMYTQLKYIFQSILTDDAPSYEMQLKKIMKDIFEHHTSATPYKEKEIILDIKTYIEAQCDTPLSVVDLARYLGYDKSYLIRLFKKEVGLTPQQYILNVKVNRAKSLLISSKANSLSHISSDAGFFDQSHMNRNFKGLFGISPKNYKKVNIVQDI